MLPTCEVLGMIGMALTFAAGYVLAYMQGLNKLTTVVMKLQKQNHDLRERCLAELEESLKKRAERLGVEWPE